MVSVSDLTFKLTDVNVPIDERMSALFDARQMGNNTAVEILLQSLEKDKEKDKPSILFQHEAAYVLGQIGNVTALNKLINLVEDPQEDEMVRHEAAEALAAIGSPTALQCLENNVEDISLPVKQTCQLALRSLIKKTSNDQPENDASELNKDSNCNLTKENSEDKVSSESEKKVDSNDETDNSEQHVNGNVVNDTDVVSVFIKDDQTTSKSEAKTNTFSGVSENISLHEKTPEQITTDGDTKPAHSEGSVYYSVDPVSAKIGVSESDIPQLKKELQDESIDLWFRYEALFSLRNIGTDEAIAAINDSLLLDKESALFRHEVAFVLGQIQHPSSSFCLQNCLENKSEHSMARHEAALAMGSIASSIKPDDSIEDKANKTSLVKSLTVNLNDVETVVNESCYVALKNICEEIGHQDHMTVLSNPLFC